MSWEEQDPDPDVELVSCHRAITKTLEKLFKIIYEILFRTIQCFKQESEILLKPGPKNMSRKNKKKTLTGQRVFCSFRLFSVLFMSAIIVEVLLSGRMN